MTKNSETISECPIASVVICTRNRGELIVDTIDSVLANTYTHFELLVIDQSTNPITENAVKRYLADKRLRYIHTESQGAGVSRYMGLVEAKGEYVLYTDDDCTVSPDWVKVITDIFKDSPKTAIIFSNVAPGKYDRAIGMVPNHIHREDRVIDSVVKYYGSIGMGAGMAVRRKVGLALGGFDQKLGPGSIFRSGEDHDIAIRALLKGWHVQETTKVTVIHSGFRTHDQFRELTGRDWFGMGAAYAKAIRAKQFSVLFLVMYNFFVRNILLPLSMVFMLQKPIGFRRAIALSQGFLAGLTAPIDENHILYK